MLDTLTFPLFVKGAVKSNKDEGWSAVVANNLEELTGLTERLLSRSHRSRGKVIVRELVKLKTVATDPNGFPIGREYRAFLYKGQILASGFYWDEYHDPTPANTDFISKLIEVSTRVDIPFISVDVGQLESGEWTVIEIGDGQFSGLIQISVLELWNKLSRL